MTAERIRLTITVSPEVHEVYSRMAEAGGMSLGKCMGDWLADTAEGAEFVALKMVEARRAPATVMREFQAMSRGMVDAVDQAADTMRAAGWKGLGAAGTAAHKTAQLGRAGKPPSSPTGVKSPRKAGKGS